MAARALAQFRFYLPSKLRSEQGLLLLLAAVSLLGIGFLPLFSGPSYEYNLAAGLLLPTLTAFARMGAPRKSAGMAAVPLLQVTAGVLAAGARFGAVALVVAVFHGLRVGFCDAATGFQYLLLGPVAGACAGSAWGELARSLCPLQVTKRGRRLLLAGLLPLLGVALSFARFYTSPIVYAFDHFAGFFSGTIYDTEIDALERLLTYRVGTLGWLLFACAVSSLWRASQTGPHASAWRQQPWSLAALLFGATLGASIWWQGPALGHFQNDATMIKVLSRLSSAGRCDVRYAGSIASADAALVATECEAHLSELERYFDVKFEARVRVWLFNSAEQKASLMGARYVYIAKPWRREIYIQQGAYPHPVLGHELAHVVAGSFGAGPFWVAGSFRGLLPDPGRIEGFAVAASPAPDDELTPRAAAAAMQRLNLLPRFAQLFQLGFMGVNSSAAYNAAGAVVDWLRAVYGPDLLKRWYRGEALASLTGTSLPELEARYLTELAQTQLSPAVLNYAKARFLRPALFARTCPHEVDGMLAAAGTALAELDLERAEAGYRDVLSLSADERSAKLGLLACTQRRGDLSALQSQALELANAETQLTFKAADLERAGDAALLASNFEGAQSLYMEAAKQTADEDSQRTLQLKLMICAPNASAAARSAVTRLILGDPVLGQNWLEAGAALAEWAEREPQQGMADYLLGRNLLGQGRRAAAKTLLSRAVSRVIPLAPMRREAYRLLLVAACAEQDAVTARLALAGYLTEAGTASENRRAAVQRFAARCGVGPAPVPSSETL